MAMTLLHRITCGKIQLSEALKTEVGRMYE